MRPSSPVLALVLALLSACSYGNVGPAENQTEASQRDAARYLELARMPLAAENVSRVRNSNDMWTGNSARRSERLARIASHRGSHTRRCSQHRRRTTPSPRTACHRHTR